jgi:excinuclease UvrABC ATPase subunit
VGLFTPIRDLFAKLPESRARGYKGKKLVEVLQLLVDQGDTIVLIEHNLDVIQQADYLIDLGPEGGEKGGQVLVAGTPEQVAKNTVSYTAQYCAGAWGRRSGSKETRANLSALRLEPSQQRVVFLQH